jgi:hypothetical protein
VSGPLVGRVLRSDVAPGDPNVRLLFVVIAEETGSPRQKDPDGWVRLGMRELATRIGCGLDTVPDVVVRAQEAGLQVDRPGVGRRMGYRLPPELLGPREHSRGRLRASPPRRTVGTTPTEVLGPSKHVPSVTQMGDKQEPQQHADTSDQHHASSPVVASGGRAATTLSLLKVGDRGASIPDLPTMTVALGYNTTNALRAREDRPPDRARASPDTSYNRPLGRKEQHVSIEADVWDQVPLPAEPLAPDENEESCEDCLEAQPA